MADPVLDLAGYAQRIAAAVGGGDVAGEFLVRQIWIVLIRAGRLDDIDPPAPLAPGHLRAPGGRVQGCAEIDVVQLPLDEVAVEPRPDQVARPQVGLGAVVKDSARWDFDSSHRRVR